MSYCRFSSDDWRCDVYCYEAGDCWVINLAGSRVLGAIPKLDWSLLCDTDEAKAELFVKQHAEQMAFLSSAKHQAIDLPFAGQSFEEYSLNALYSRLLYLREIGYRIPDNVFEQITSEIAEGTE